MPLLLRPLDPDWNLQHQLPWLSGFWIQVEVRLWLSWVSSLQLAHSGTFELCNSLSQFLVVSLYTHTHTHTRTHTHYICIFNWFCFSRGPWLIDILNPKWSLFFSKKGGHRARAALQRSRQDRGIRRGRQNPQNERNNIGMSGLLMTQTLVWTDGRWSESWPNMIPHLCETPMEKQQSEALE